MAAGGFGVVEFAECVGKAEEGGGVILSEGDGALEEGAFHAAVAALVVAFGGVDVGVEEDGLRGAVGGGRVGELECFGLAAREAQVVVECVGGEGDVGKQGECVGVGVVEDSLGVCLEKLPCDGWLAGRDPHARVECMGRGRVEPGVDGAADQREAGVGRCEDVLRAFAGRADDEPGAMEPPYRTVGQRAVSCCAEHVAECMPGGGPLEQDARCTAGAGWCGLQAFECERGLAGGNQDLGERGPEVGCAGAFAEGVVEEGYAAGRAVHICERFGVERQAGRGQVSGVVGEQCGDLRPSVAIGEPGREAHAQFAIVGGDAEQILPDGVGLGGLVVGVVGAGEGERVVVLLGATGDGAREKRNGARGMAGAEGRGAAFVEAGGGIDGGRFGWIDIGDLGCCLRVRRRREREREGGERARESDEVQKGNRACPRHRHSHTLT